METPRNPVTFTADEVAYLHAQPLGRLATLGPGGQPFNAPVAFDFDERLGVIWISGSTMASTAKYRNVLRNPKVAFVVDDVLSMDPWQPRGITMRGVATALDADSAAGRARGGRAVIRITPLRVVSWAVNSSA
ncbi:PPOX class F420-dependent oxidoreductase [Streptomyces inhibens]|uniref:PPOX class F420-dependent oxidoreductase n=1 Tax=Streptomyces inhibens TaxID=2293571 RepID=UPI001EE6CEF7|nr:PPOX class F420-dependent oxidoreductase [Streptomyces inhibens]UKY51763.1 PPOX class F420-dependent oxidoreductase [Streptomyces inhibens]